MKKQIALFILILSLFGTAYGMEPNTSGGHEMPVQSLESSLSTFIAQQVSRSLEPIIQRLTDFGNRIEKLEHLMQNQATAQSASTAPAAPSFSAAAVAATVSPSRVRLRQWQIQPQLNLNTRLSEECLHGNLRNVKTLVQQGAKVNTKSFNSESTPLHFAAFNGHLPVVTFLIGQHADRTARITTGRYAGKTALDLARERRHGTVISYLESLDQSTAAATTTAITREMTPEEQAACRVLQSLASQDRKHKADDQPSREASRDTKKTRVVDPEEKE